MTNTENCPMCRAPVYVGLAPRGGIVAHCGRQLVTARIFAPRKCRLVEAEKGRLRQRARYREILFAAQRAYLASIGRAPL